MLSLNNYDGINYIIYKQHLKKKSVLGGSLEWIVPIKKNIIDL